MPPGKPLQEPGRAVSVARLRLPGFTMDFQLTDDQRAIEDAARRFAVERLAPNAGDWDHRAHFPVDVMREAAALGFASIYIKSDVGGSEMCRLDAAIIFE